MRKILIVSMLVTLAACVKTPPNTSFEGKIAVQGLQVVTAVKAALPALEVITCKTATQVACVKVDDSLKVVEKLQQVANEGDRLVAALKVIDSTNGSVEGKTDAMTKAKQTLATMQNLLVSASIIPGDADARAEVAKLFSNITTLMFAIQGL